MLLVNVLHYTYHKCYLMNVLCEVYATLNVLTCRRACKAGSRWAAGGAATRAWPRACPCRRARRPRLHTRLLNMVLAGPPFSRNRQYIAFEQLYFSTSTFSYE